MERVLAGSKFDPQIELERESITRGVRRYREQVADAERRGEAASLKPGERLIVAWLDPLSEAIKKLQRIRKLDQRYHNSTCWQPILRMLDSDRAALITIRQVLSSVMVNPLNTKMVKVYYEIGSEIIAEIGMDTLRKRARVSRRLVAAEGYNARTAEQNHHDYLTRRFRRLTYGRVNWWTNKHLDNPIHNRRACVAIGATLFYLLSEIAQITVRGEPTWAFRVRWDIEHRKRYNMLTVNSAVLTAIERGHSARSILRPRYLPTVVEPLYSDDNDEIGYVSIRAPFVSKPCRELKGELGTLDISLMRKARADVSSAAWRVNGWMLDTMTALTKRGDAPSLPPSRNPPKPSIDPDATPDIVAAYKVEAKRWHKQRVKLAAERTLHFGMIENARLMSRYRRFWLPHQVDFRGRAYPIPQFNHHRADPIRSLLEIADGIEPGDAGRVALCRHAAGCWGNGIDKLPMDRRVDWAVSNVGKMMECVNDPGGTDWWREAEDPWLFLAACRGIVDEEAGAHLPVDMDGSCNGLQHYAALSRDAVGASMVNMLPSDVPSDVYSAVAERVKALAVQDAADGNEMAAKLIDVIARKVVKQTTMTKVYGVTTSGAREQVRSALRKAGCDIEDMREAAKYLAARTLDGIGEVCVGAAKVMDWMKACAKLIGLIRKQTIRWTTPLGWCVIQPYRRWRTMQVKTVMQNVSIMVEDEHVPVDVRKQINGVAPNFIHSIDATHMFKTAMRCKEQGVWFAAVHDCYRTHAATAGKLARTLREQFVEMHSQPILSELRDQWTKRYALEFPEPPIVGTLDVSQVLGSDYFFS